MTNNVITVWVYSVDSVRPQKNEGTSWRQHCVLCCPSMAKRGNIVARRTDARFSETFFVARTQSLCPPQISRARRNETTFGANMLASAILPSRCVLVLPGPNASSWQLIIGVRLAKHTLVWDCQPHHQSAQC